MQNGAKKSFYVFLCGLLGMMLFILLQRSLFLLAYLLGWNVLSDSFQQVDYTSFVAAMFLGLWYGIWVGLYWYQVVYEDRSVNGMFRGLWNKLGGNSMDRAIREPSETWDLEDLMKAKSEAYKPQDLGPTLEVFESSTVAFTTNSPVHADNLHNEFKTESKPKRATTPRKPAVKKTARKVE